MDKATFETRFNRLLAMRGDPARGVPVTAWSEALEGEDPDQLLRAAIAVVRDLLVQDWADTRKDDKRPQRAIAAAEAWLANKTSEEVLKEAKTAAKECTAAKNETFGTQHRVPEAARALAWSAGAKDTSNQFDALALAEAELLARVALTAEYHRGPEQRRAIVDTLRKVLVPAEAPADVPAPSSRAAGPPVPYSADGHFELGQNLVHKKFGDVMVTSVGETWIEVELPDQTKKRLAHKP